MDIGSLTPLTTPAISLTILSSTEVRLFDLRTDLDEQLNLIGGPEHAEVYRRLDNALTAELMRSMSLSMHDRMPRPHSMSEDEDMGREGWTWSFPAPVDATGEQAFYL